MPRRVPFTLPRLLPGQIQDQDHPAFRSAYLVHRQSQDSSSQSPTSTFSTTCTDWKRDSALGTLSSVSTTLPDEDCQDYTRVKLDSPDAASSTYSTEDAWPLPLLPEPAPVRPRRTSSITVASTSASPHYNLHNARNARNLPRYSCQSRWSITESDASESDSVKDKSSTRRLIRGLSVRLAPTAMKRMKKQAQAEADLAAEATPSPRPTSAAPHDGRLHDPDADLDESHSHLVLQGSPAPQFYSSPNLAGPSRQEIGDNDNQSPISSNPGPLSHEITTSFPATDLAPTINTDIPQGSFLVNLEDLSFSKRGSIYFGDTRAISSSTQPTSPRFMDKFTEPRAAPSTPTLPIDGAYDSRPATSESKRHRGRKSKEASVPDIRVMSEDTEMESQKVRSLYESTDLVHWEDGAPGRRSSELLEPPEEVPSDGESNIAYGFPVVLHFAVCCSMVSLIPALLLSQKPWFKTKTEKRPGHVPLSYIANVGNIATITTR